MYINMFLHKTIQLQFLTIYFSKNMSSLRRKLGILQNQYGQYKQRI